MPHQRHARGHRQRIPARDVEARHRHADDALHADQREALGELAPQLGRHDALTLGALLDLLEQARDRHHRPGKIRPQIGAPGDALLGLDIDQQQRRLGDAAAAGAERVGHRHLDADGGNGADGERGKSTLARHSRSPPGPLANQPADPWTGGLLRGILESLTQGTHIGINRMADERCPSDGVP